jgi:hypothetical protein
MNCPHLDSAELDPITEDVIRNLEAVILPIISNPATTHKIAYLCLDVEPNFNCRTE